MFKAKDKDNTLYAIKHIKYETNEEGIPATALREISLLKSIGPHPNIVKYLICYVES